MKIGICSSAENIEHLKAIKKSGFDYLETQIAPLAELNDIEFKEFVHRLEDMDLPIRANLLLFPRQAVLVGKDADMQFLQNFAEKAVYRATQLGSEVIIFGHGKTRSYGDGVTKDEAYRDNVKILSMVSKIAGKNGIQVVIEPLTKKETNMFNTYHEAISAVQEINEPALGCLCDWYHAWMENQSPDEMAQMPEKLLHLHIAYPNGRTVPSMQDDFSVYEPFFRVVKKIGYNNKISIEANVPKTADYFSVIQEGLLALRAILRANGLGGN